MSTSPPKYHHVLAFKHGGGVIELIRESELPILTLKEWTKWKTEAQKDRGTVILINHTVIYPDN